MLALMLMFNMTGAIGTNVFYSSTNARVNTRVSTDSRREWKLRPFVSRTQRRNMHWGKMIKCSGNLYILKLKLVTLWIYKELHSTNPVITVDLHVRYVFSQISVGFIRDWYERTVVTR